MQVPSAQPLSVRVVLADDHDLVRSGIKALLAGIPGVTVVAEASDGSELIAAVEHFHPDIVMTDISMPGMDGLSAISKLHQQFPKVRLAVVSTHDTVDVIKRAVACGACAYLTKNASPAELEQAVRCIMAGSSYFSNLVARRLLQPAEATIEEELTGRQIEILRLLAQGLAAKEIAYQLGLSSKTVDVHRTRIMERLNLRDLPSLTRYAIRKNLIQA